MLEYFMDLIASGPIKMQDSFPQDHSHIRRLGCSLYLLGGGGRKKAVLAPLRIFSLKTSTVGAFTVPLRVLCQKIFIYLFILPHHKYNENNKKMERIDLTMARKTEVNYEAYITYLGLLSYCFTR